MNMENIEHLGLLRPDKSIQYDSVLEYIKTIGDKKQKQTKTEDYGIVNSISDLREDKVIKSPGYDKVFLNAKKRDGEGDGDYFVAPRVVE
ncbi:MAG: hypothetical protein FWC00_01425 [Firmicutes bacterium]|nr:hypothetical protein [Bacillota bacterium]